MNVLFRSRLVRSKWPVKGSALFLNVDRCHELHVKAPGNLSLQEIAEDGLTIQNLLQHGRTSSVPTGDSYCVNWAVSAEIRLVECGRQL